MHIISFRTLREYFDEESNSRVALQDWYKLAKRSHWNNFTDLKNSFNSADDVGNGRFVFNVKGNHYHIVAIVRFNYGKILIRWVGNHKDYYKLKDINKL